MISVVIINAIKKAIQTLSYEYIAPRNDNSYNMSTI